MLRWLAQRLRGGGSALVGRFWLDDSWIVQMKRGRRAVGFVENLDEQACARAEQQVLELLGPRVQFVRRPVRGRIDLVYGYARVLVEEAAAELDRLESAAGHPVQSIRRIGQLLGYPDCCVRAFCVPDAFRTEVLGWSYLEQRSLMPGAIDPRLNPFTGLKLYHLPCRIDCPETLAQVEQVTRGLRRASRRRLREALALGRAPVLFAPDDFPRFAVLLGAEELAPGLFRYRGVCSSRLHELDLERGNLLRVREARVTLHADHRRLARHEGGLAIWWHRRALDASFWLAEAARRRASYASVRSG